MEVDETEGVPTGNDNPDVSAVAMQMFQRTAKVLIELPRGTKKDGKNKYHTIHDDLGVLLRHWENFATNKENRGPATRADPDAQERLRKRDSARKIVLQKGA